MKASLWMQSAVVAVCVTHAPACPQTLLGPGGGVPSGSFGQGPKIPGIGDGPFGSNSGPGSFSPIPGEPRMSDVVKGGNPWAPRQGTSPTPNPGAPAPIPLEVIERLINPPPISPPLLNLPPINPLPSPVAPRPIPFGAPSWLRWEWAAGISVLCLLAALLCRFFARKQTSP